MMSNKKLAFILLALLTLFGLTQLFNTKKERSFKAELLKIDTSMVDRIVIHAVSDQHKELVLSKTGSSSWTATQSGKSVPAVAGSLDGILKELPLMKVKSIATQSKDRYNEYEISDSVASHIEVYSGNKKLTDFYSGKFGFNPQTNSMLSYIRMKDDPSVYTVDGFQSMTFNPSFSSFRDKTITAFGSDPIEKVGIIHQGVKSELRKSDLGWAINGTVVKDSTALQNYFSGLLALNGNELMDELGSSTLPIHSASIFAGGKTINLDLYSSGDSTKPFIVHSSVNPDVYFKEDSSGTFRTVILGIQNLTKLPVLKKK